MAGNLSAVIPFVGADKPVKNVITVAKENGDFSDPVAAMNSITDSSDANPYVLVIGPGVYTLTQQLIIQPSVEVIGSGIDITILQGSKGAEFATDEAALVTSIAQMIVISNPLHQNSLRQRQNNNNGYK